jgi:hypothetical protein
VARWVYADAVHPERMAQRLAEQGIRPTARNTWFDLGRERRLTAGPFPQWRSLW